MYAFLTTFLMTLLSDFLFEPSLTFGTYSSLPNTSLGRDNSLGWEKSENLGQDSSLGWEKEKT